MMPKVKKPDPPKALVQPADLKAFAPADETSRAYSSLINTGPMGLQKKALTAKKSLLGGV